MKKLILGIFIGLAIAIATYRKFHPAPTTASALPDAGVYAGPESQAPGANLK